MSVDGRSWGDGRSWDTDGPFTADRTHGIGFSEHSVLDVSSDDLGWVSAYVSRQRETPHHERHDARPDPMIALALDGPARLSLAVKDDRERLEVLPGSFGMIPAGAACDVHLEHPLESVHAYVRQTVIEEVASDLYEGDPAEVELIPRFATLDPVVEHMTFAMLELARDAPPASALYVDHLARGFAAHLIHKHSTLSDATPARQEAGGLGARDIESVRELVNASLASPLSLADLAGATSLSPGHFARLFKRSLGVTPYQFVLRTRVERAQRLLAETDAPISHIGMDCGFSHQMHLTQVFHRLVGTTPAEYRKVRRK